jgi:hypothetical protein
MLDSVAGNLQLWFCREQSIAAAKKQVEQQLGSTGVNLLVNNAGRPLTSQPSE